MTTEVPRVEHLYVHVPFCAAKCHYCAFYSEEGSADKMGEYVEAVMEELCVASGALALQPKTIFFGGGTPSLLPAPLMRQLLEAVGRVYPPQAGKPPGAPLEWTIECNPSTVSTEKANLFREFGVNRISMGVQALDDELLDVIGRVHSVKAAIESYEKLRAAGFDNINLDLMFGLPGQTMEHWRNTLDRAIALQPEHISTYCLILEEDTEFWRMYHSTDVWRVGLQPDRSSSARLEPRPPELPNEEQELAMYEMAIEVLTAAGYRQYEISNFAKPGRDCAHNIAYWEGKNYLGLGPSACSTVDSRRWQNVPDIDQYVAAFRLVGRGRRARRAAISFQEILTPELRAAERAAFGMRMNAGVPAELVRGRWDKQIGELLSAELVEWRNGRLSPTKQGILFADEVASNFV